MYTIIYKVAVKITDLDHTPMKRIENDVSILGLSLLFLQHYYHYK